jgi:hypothetical protein
MKIYGARKIVKGVGRFGLQLFLVGFRSNFLFATPQHTKAAVTAELKALHGKRSCNS